MAFEPIWRLNGKPRSAGVSGTIFTPSQRRSQPQAGRDQGGGIGLDEQTVIVSKGSLSPSRGLITLEGRNRSHPTGNSKPKEKQL
jgi:predicted oxidoreductase